jgi:O-antigen/teichoic acid export membrane protein
MVPLYLNFIDINTYGSWLATGNLIGLVSVLEAGLAFIITQKLAVAWQTNDKLRFSKLAGSSVIVALVIALIILLLTWVMSFFIAGWVNTPDDDVDILKLSILVSGLTAAFTILFSVAGTYAQVWQQTFFPGLANVISSIAGIVTIYYLLINSFNVLSIALGYLVRSTLYLLLLLIFNVRQWKKRNLQIPTTSFLVFKEIIKDMALPFMAKLATLIVNNSQSFIIASVLHQPSMAAIYDITAKVATTARMFVGMLNGSVFAGLSLSFASHDLKYKKQTFLKIDFIFFFLLFASFLFSFLFTEEIVRYWVGIDKFGGYWLLALIIIAMLVAEIRNFYNSILMAMGEIGKTALYDLYNSLIYLVLLFFLVRYVNIIAIPISLLLAGAPILLLYENKIRKKIFISIKKYYCDKLYFFASHFLIASIGIYFLKASNSIIDLSVIIVLSAMIYLFLFSIIDKRMKYFLSIVKSQFTKHF